MRVSKKIVCLLASAVTALLSGCIYYPKDAIVLKEQGSMTFAGTANEHSGKYSSKNFLSPEGQKAYGDHGYAFYQIPRNG